MSKYPLARWSPGTDTFGASVWTRKVPEGEGGGYFLYTWKQGADSIAIEELAKGTTQDERRRGARSVYVHTGDLPVPEAVRLLDSRREQDREVARIIYADMQQRFGEVAEWITYDTSGNSVWFHEEVTGK